MHTMLLKAALPSIPVVNQLPGVRKTGGDPSSLHELRTATVTREHVTAYARVCGFPVKDTAPLTFPHVLAFPLHMAVMTVSGVPVPGHRHGAPRQQHHPAPSDRRRRDAADRGPRLARAPTPEGPGGRLPRHRSRGRGDALGEHVDVPAARALVGRRRGLDRLDRRRPTTRATWCPDGSRGGWAATSAAGTPRCPATTTRSTSTRSPPRPWASAVRSRTGCGASPAASRRWRTGMPGRGHRRRSVHEADLPARHGAVRAGRRGRRGRHRLRPDLSEGRHAPPGRAYPGRKLVPPDLSAPAPGAGR